MKERAWVLLLVALFGAAGAVSRYEISTWLSRLVGGRFPAGTFAVNVAGCFALGLVMHLGLKTDLSETTRLALTVGFLGALTTFSTFGYETVGYLQEEAWLLAFANVAANLVLGFAAVWLGLALGKFLVGG